MGFGIGQPENDGFHSKKQLNLQKKLFYTCVGSHLRSLNDLKMVVFPKNVLYFMGCYCLTHMNETNNIVICEKMILYVNGKGKETLNGMAYTKWTENERKTIIESVSMISVYKRCCLIDHEQSESIQSIGDLAFAKLKEVFGSRNFTF